MTDRLPPLLAGELADPHSVLGRHGDTVTVLRPGASAVELLVGNVGHPMEQVHPAGVFEATLPASEPGYRLRITDAGGQVLETEDPYRFVPTIGELDLYLLGEGRHRRLWEVLGSRIRLHDGVAGTSFAVWAPNARAARVVGDFNNWDGRFHPMRSMGVSGVWELFVPGIGQGTRYKFELLTAARQLRLKADPMARSAESAPGTASIVTASSHEWGDGEWIEARNRRGPLDGRMSTYEVHLGSWRTVPEEGDRPLTYRELAGVLVDHVAELGFTHVELLPVSEHPYTPSWGYQVTSYYAPTARYGSPDDFRFLVDAFHQRGIAVIVDWVPAHFPKDDWALARFDGTNLYEHADPRQGEHPDWGTLVFNFGRPEVRNFLLGSALYWMSELHLDGVRVDAVASMLYLDYSREPGQWVANAFGGRENLEAVSFLQELNTVVHAELGGVVTIAEESTAWPGVTWPADGGGLGFTHKWNMGWMHDTLGYLARDPLYRRFHQGELTFGLLYAFSERFVLPLSHDEVVHGKGSLLTKMPGDRWQQLANLRSLYGWMWAHPGRQLLFMGCEVADDREWSESRSVGWHLLDSPWHRGVQDLIVALNRLQAAETALWSGDFSGEGFRWIDVDDADQSCLSFLRLAVGDEGLDASGALARPVACIANFTPVPRHGYRIGLPAGGRWEVLLNTDALEFAGSGTEVGPVLESEAMAWQGFEQSAVVTLPPLGVIWLAPLAEA